MASIHRKNPTKNLIVLSPNQLRTALCWFSFVGPQNFVEADVVVTKKLSKDFVPLNTNECQVLLRWWNYLPGSLIDPSDDDLYETIRGFLYDK